MLIRIDILVYAILLLPLVFAGMASAGFYFHPPRTSTGVIALVLAIGLPLYFAGIIVHYKLFKEQRGNRSGSSPAFAIVLIVTGYALGVYFGALIFH